MRSFIKGIILLPIAIIVVLLAVANRHAVQISLDPFSEVPEIAVQVPLFLVAFGAVMLGVIIGGVGAWLAQTENRRERRQAMREVSRLRAEAERARTTSAAGRSVPTTLPAIRA